MKTLGGEVGICATIQHLSLKDNIYMEKSVRIYGFKMQKLSAAGIPGDQGLGKHI